MEMQQINLFIINEIKLLSDNPREFTTYNIFKILEKYLKPQEVMNLLGIGRSTYYNYKNKRESKYVDNKIYKFYQDLNY